MRLQNLLNGIEDYITSFDIKPEDWEIIEVDYQESFAFSLHCKGELMGEFTEKYFAEAVRDLLIDRTYRTRQWSTINWNNVAKEASKFLKENSEILNALR